MPSEGKADVELGAEEPIASPEENEEKVPEEAVGDAADFDMQEFLDGEPADIASSDEANVTAEEDVVSEVITEGGQEAPSKGKVEAEDQVASSEGIEKKAPESSGGDTSDFDIQGFLDELENIPSENDSES
ncbi:MAG: hypothetical protein R2568_07080 [Candidatus Scalindua sp.]|jgi:hypothetical protein|nr:hypothetical protein [Candidatus Scalindua sp.]MDV5166498.1 hypothetical protein [Candidatus Scalindua sp.]